MFLLPFQLYTALGWVTIPASVAAAYIILGILFIGQEIENPFGEDTNDLPLESFCAQVAAELDVIASRRKPRCSEWVEHVENRPLWPLSSSGWHVWMHRDGERVRDAVRTKTEIGCARKARKGKPSVHKEVSSGESTPKKKGSLKVEVSQV